MFVYARKLQRVITMTVTADNFDDLFKDRFLSLPLLMGLICAPCSTALQYMTLAELRLANDVKRAKCCF